MIDRRTSFWDRVAITDDPNECWLWRGSLSGGGAAGGGGYGHYGNRTAHRVAFERTYGQIHDRKILVLHRCDNRACCNPRHLFLGSHKVNAQDMVAKGRHRGGMPKGFNQHSIHLRRLDGSVKHGGAYS